MPFKPRRPALAIFLLAAACAHQALGATTTTSGFVVSSTATTAESNPAVASQAYLKQWTISGEEDVQLAAIETLAIDIPGQVFVTYESPTTEAASKTIGSVKVYGATKAIVDAVSVARKRAMRGAKLAISSTKSSALKTAAGNSSDSAASDPLLTEVVLTRKSALKKVITNGWADVVIADYVLYSKRKEDYTYKFGRALRASVAAASDNTSSIALVQMQREVVPFSSTSKPVNPIWTIITPTTSTNPVSFSVDVKLQDASQFANLYRVDSDFLPEGAVGTVSTSGGTASVTTTRTADGRDTIVVTPSGANASVNIDIAADVGLNTASLNTTAERIRVFQSTLVDDAVSIFLNGSGNVFVLANDSAVFVKRASFRVAGSGFLQLQINELRAAGIFSAGRDFMGRFEIPTGEKIIGLSILVGGSKPSSTSNPPNATTPKSSTWNVSLCSAALAFATVALTALL